MRVHDLVPDQYLSHFAMKLSTLLRPIMCTVLEAATITALVISIPLGTRTLILCFGDKDVSHYTNGMYSVFYLPSRHSRFHSLVSSRLEKRSKLLKRKVEVSIPLLSPTGQVFKTCLYASTLPSVCAFGTNSELRESNPPESQCYVFPKHARHQYGLNSGLWWYFYLAPVPQAFFRFIKLVSICILLQIPI